MEVILLNDVEKVGLRGDIVNVARGYARNFLLPRRLAEPATPAKVAELRRRDERRARQEARTLEQGQEIADQLREAVLHFEVKAGPTGSLFGSVTPTDLADELWRAHKVRVDRRRIDLPEPIRRIGRYEVPVEIFADVTVELKTHVVPEGGELPPEDEPSAQGAEGAHAQDESETPAAPDEARMAMEPSEETPAPEAAAQ